MRNHQSRSNTAFCIIYLCQKIHNYQRLKYMLSSNSCLYWQHYHLLYFLLTLPATGQVFLEIRTGTILLILSKCLVLATPLAARLVFLHLFFYTFVLFCKYLRDVLRSLFHAKKNTVFMTRCFFSFS